MWDKKGRMSHNSISLEIAGKKYFAKFDTGGTIVFSTTAEATSGGGRAFAGVNSPDSIEGTIYGLKSEMQSLLEVFKENWLSEKAGAGMFAIINQVNNDGISSYEYKYQNAHFSAEPYLDGGSEIGDRRALVIKLSLNKKLETIFREV
ncbi:MAG: hypothetical protein ACRCYP_07210 [Alphaproteobacteria bacterium]